MRASLVLATFSLWITYAAAAAPVATTQQDIDKLFAAWNQKGTPGAVLAVVRDGKVIHRGAYGMADIERAMANRAATNFHVASVSKQFTAFAVHLLAKEGKLSLDDDVRKHLPELHDFGQVITIRHLIHHTSGLRDQWSLLALAGWRLQDVITEDDVMGLVRRQRQLNFVPGKEHVYSNTGYTLLGMIVKRVSGKSLPAFTKERMFDPLGMKRTHFQDNYQTLVNGRANSYDKAGSGYQYVALSYSNVGATSLFTTVDDLVRWDQNFYDGKVGGKDMLAEWQTRGRLLNGRELDYAGGLQISTYRGADVVGHGGGDAGFRSYFLRFPKQRTSIVLLSNAGDLDPGKLAHKVADVVLGNQLDPVPAAAPVKEEKGPVEIKLDPAKLDAFVGDYALAPDFVLSFTKEQGQLMTQATGQGKLPVFASGERTFFLKVVDAQFVFDAPGPDGVVGGGTLHQNGRKQPAKRVTMAALSAPELAAREGLFHSEELNVLYTVSQSKGKLVLHHPRGELSLSQTNSTTFHATFPIGKVEYDCATPASCNSFTVSNGRVRNLLFSKVTIKQTAPSGPLSGVAQPASKVSPFASGPVYLRGSMNKWDIVNQLQPAGGKTLSASVMIDAGVHEFKVGSHDFTQVDFGGMPGAAAMTVGQPLKMEATGANLKLNVPARAEYVFALDVSNPAVPVLTVTDKR